MNTTRTKTLSVLDAIHVWEIFISIVGIGCYEFLRWQAIRDDRLGQFLNDTFAFSSIAVRIGCLVFALFGFSWFLFRNSVGKNLVLVGESIWIILVLIALNLSGFP